MKGTSSPCPKGGGQEELPHVRGHGQRPRVPGWDGAGTAREELPHVRGQGQWPRVPGCDCTGTTERSYPASEVGGVAERSYPASEVRGGGREDQPYLQEAVTVRAQEGLEELSHVEGQEGRQ